MLGSGREGEWGTRALHGGAQIGDGNLHKGALGWSRKKLQWKARSTDGQGWAGPGYARARSWHGSFARKPWACNLRGRTKLNYLAPDTPLGPQEVYFGNHFALEGTSRKKSDICRWVALWCRTRALVYACAWRK